ncbi:MAG: TIGR00269 family protein [Chloroflexi bacterium]|nr:TIGR00269 family protein [Chloroflexota bacterium]
MKCVKCKGVAAIDIRRHNSAFCSDHFLEYFRNQVAKAIHDENMFTKDDRILVAVSGGKDSLALWDLLLEDGYNADGLYIDLGIPGYSDPSKETSVAFAEARNAVLRIVELEANYGYNVDGLAQLSRRASCSACGLSKRYLFNKVARDFGYDVVATGHNLDDEAATLLGNVLHWQTGYLARQSPVLEAREDSLIKKVKPLYRLSERETVSYTVLKGIEYIADECPNAHGARSIMYKDMLNMLERQSPGSKHQFLYGFFEKARPLYHDADPGHDQVHECPECGQPTTGTVCAFCRMMSQVRFREANPRGKRAHTAAIADAEPAPTVEAAPTA